MFKTPEDLPKSSKEVLSIIWKNDEKEAFFNSLICKDDQFFESILENMQQTYNVKSKDLDEVRAYYNFLLTDVTNITKKCFKKLSAASQKDLESFYDNYLKPAKRDRYGEIYLLKAYEEMKTHNFTNFTKIPSRIIKLAELIQVGKINVAVKFKKFTLSIDKQNDSITESINNLKLVLLRKLLRIKSNIKISLRSSCLFTSYFISQRGFNPDILVELPSKSHALDLYFFLKKYWNINHELTLTIRHACHKKLTRCFGFFDENADIFSGLSENSFSDSLNNDKMFQNFQHIQSTPFKKKIYNPELLCNRIIQIEEPLITLCNICDYMKGLKNTDVDLSLYYDITPLSFVSDKVMEMSLMVYKLLLHSPALESEKNTSDDKISKPMSCLRNLMDIYKEKGITSINLSINEDSVGNNFSNPDFFTNDFVDESRMFTDEFSNQSILQFKQMEDNSKFSFNEHDSENHNKTIRKDFHIIQDINEEETVDFSGKLNELIKEKFDK